MINRIIIASFASLISCQGKLEKIRPSIEPISESIYASGVLKSKNQYQVYPTVSGIIDQVFVSEGDTIKKGSPLLFISNENQRLNSENLELTLAFSDLSANRGKLNEASWLVDQTRNKMKNDSALYFRQMSLWQQEVGTKSELEQRELSYQNSKTAYNSSIVKYNELRRQLNFTYSQTKKNLQISNLLESNYTIKSEIDGIVYSLSKTKGEIVGQQTALAIIGDARIFILEMQVDENDILKLRKGLQVLIIMDSYKGKVFEATVTKINPIMNERNKTFLVEAEFLDPPERLYPNISFEANIVLKTKEKAILIPRTYLLNDSLVIKSNGDTVVVKTGLRDYQKVEISSGIGPDDELLKPKE